MIDPRVACAECGGEGSTSHEVPRATKRIYMECPTCSGTGVASAEEVALRAIDEVYSTQTGSKSRNVIARVTVGTTRLYLESVFAARAEALKR